MKIKYLKHDIRMFSSKHIIRDENGELISCIIAISHSTIGRMILRMRGYTSFYHYLCREGMYYKS